MCKVVLKEFRINIFRQFLNTHWKTIALVTPPSTCGGLWNKTNSTSMTSITSNVAHLVVSPKVHCDKNEEKVQPHLKKNLNCISIQILCEINFDHHKGSGFEL